MPKPEIEEFAKLLVTLVRDKAIAACDALIRPEANSPPAKRWREAFDQGNAELVKAMIPDCVDETLFCLLDAIDSGGLRLSFTAGIGASVDLADEGMGELAGWYAGIDAWVAKYSQERFFDDLEDLGNV